MLLAVLSDAAWGAIATMVVCVVGFVATLVRQEKKAIERKKDTQEIRQDIKENTSVNENALNAANRFNLKMAAMHDRVQVIENDFMPGSELRRMFGHMSDRLTQIESHMGIETKKQ